MVSDAGRTRLASYAVILDEHTILLTRIAPGSDGAGLWTLPGGGLDFGEHPDDALMREVYEETGLTIESFELAGIHSVVFPASDTRSGMHAVRFIYRVTATGTPHITEIDGSVDRVEWVTLGAVDALDCVELVAVGRTIARV